MAPKPTYGEVVEPATFDKMCIGCPETTIDHYGDVDGEKGIRFKGYRKSLYA